MIEYIEEIVGFAAAAAFIATAATLAGHIKAWGHAKRYGDIPLGVLFGIVASAQMFLPLEPFDGLIFDLRNIPLVLAGAFFGWRAALVAAVLAAWTRAGLGGAGAQAGIISILCAAAIGHMWQRIYNPQVRTNALGIPQFVRLGVATCLTLLTVFLLPVQFQKWFALNAAPVFALLYLTLVPMLAWHMADRLGFRADKAFSLSNQKHGTHLQYLPLPAFIRKLRIARLSGETTINGGAMCIDLTNLKTELQRSQDSTRNDILEAALTRLSEHLPDITSATSVNASTILLELNDLHLRNIEQIRHIVVTHLTTEPLRLGPQNFLWLTCEIGFISNSSLIKAGGFQADAVWRYRARHSGTKRKPKPVLSVVQTDQFANVEELDVLFAKADLMMDPAA